MKQSTSLIWNPLLRQHQISAPHRMQRREGTTACPFCQDITSGKVAPDSRVWLHPNDFPPFQPPVGEAYVVIYSQDHNRTFTQLTVDEVSEIAHLWRDLYRDLAERYVSVMIFENSGTAIGQTQLHPHGQTYGLSVVPPVLEREIETVIQEQEAGNRCPFCRIREDLTGQPFELAATPTWQAFLPPYARYPYEVHLYPVRHLASLKTLRDDELHDLATLLLDVIRGYNALNDGAMAPMPYLLGFHQFEDERFHLHVEILAIGRAPGKLKYAASSEALWGMWTNDSDPVEKALDLRAAIEKVKIRERDS